MGFKLPPLSSVRVFEAAARHGSFKKAAEELNITASAVSHAVQNLEDWLGVALFQRGGGKLGLTEPGAAYAVAVGEALKAVAEATARLPGRRSQGRLAISSAPGFAARWLLPRLSRFTERYPETGVDIETSLKAVDLPMEGIDAAIRLAPASRATPSWTRLLDESLVPVCSPSLLEKYAGLSGLKLIASADLIHMTSVSGDWAGDIRLSEVVVLAGAPTESEWERVRAFVRRTSRESLPLRFGQAADFADDHTLKRFFDIKGGGGEMIWILEEGGDICAIAHLVRLSSAQAEIALIVRTDCARRGIGEMLLRTTLARAARRNLGTLSALVLHENTAMLRLARKVGFEAHKSSGLVVELEFDLG
jgi:DNA-binding transcriptional LysR family regulator